MTAADGAIVPIWARWDAPAHVRALTTTRSGGTSAAAFASLNLAAHVGDDPARVAANRALLRAALDLPAEPSWLAQVHGCAVAAAGPAGAAPPEADAALTRTPGRVCAVLTADCLPVLLTDRAGKVAAAAHAGWRGLLDGVLEATVAALDTAPDDVFAWLGPAIGPDAFEVGPEVRDQFLARGAESAAAFRRGRGDRWWADLYLLARQRLAGVGVRRVTGGDFCTCSEPRRFFSYRRDGHTGRMASLIWLEPAGSAAGSGAGG